MKRLLVYLSVLVIVATAVGCSENHAVVSRLDDDKKELQGKITKLEKDKGLLQEKNASQQEKIAALSIVTKDGLEIDEFRKQLAVRQANIEHRDKIVTEMEERSRQREVSIIRKESEFYEKNQITLQEIGAAKQIKEQSGNMRTDKLTAERRANSWMRYFAVMSVAVFISVVTLVIYLMRHVHKSKQIDAAMRVIESESLPAQSKKLLAHALCRPLIEGDVPDADDMDV